MFAFAVSLTLSPIISLLILGYGNSKSDQSNLINAIFKLRKKIETEIYELEKITDPVAIDYWLAKQGEFFTTAEFDILALSLNNQTVVEVGGGVIGSPFERVQSARGEMEFIKENICIVSYPGGPGLALIGINEEAIKKFKGIISKIEKEKPKIDKMLDLIAETPVAAAIIILDGCGTSEMGGGLYIKGINLKKVYYLPYDKVSGYFNLEIYLCGC